MASRAGITVEGAGRLALTMRAAARDLDDMSRRLGPVVAIIERVTAAATPVKTGALRASTTSAATSAGAYVGNTAVYAGPINFGWPRRGIEPRRFLPEPAQHAAALWLPAYAQAVDDVLDQIKGR